MKRKLKRFISSLLTLIMSLNMVTVSLGAMLYEDCADEQTLTSGVVYKKLSRLYPAGWMDIYVLEIDPKNENVGFKVLESTQELGLKHTVEQLAKSNNALAAVNGDFFGSGSPLSSMGQVARNGQMEAVQNYYNGSENRYAGFFVDGDSVPFIDYVKSTIGFYNLDDATLEMGAKNKYTDFSKPVYFDRNSITSTAQLDARRSDLAKIVVKDGVIADITGVGETVEVPENGYIIVMNAAIATAKMGNYSIGQKVGFSESNNFVFRPEKSMGSVKIGISGGGELLRNGEIVSNGLIISEGSRNPRTLIGVNKNKDKVYIACIDGRGDSIGATHVEAAEIMADLGAYDAIHFDGGGSTTMALQQENDDEIKVVNTPSEGAQRQVANGFGVASIGESQGLTSLKVVLEDNEDALLFKNYGTSFTVYGRDNNLNPVDVNKSALEYSSTLKGNWNGNTFIPSEIGEGVVTVKSGNAKGSIKIKVIEGASGLKLSAVSNTLSVGGSFKINAEAVNKDGFAIPAQLSDIKWSVDDESVASISGGVLYAKKEGSATVTASYGDAVAKLTLSIGNKYVAVMSFEAKRKLTTTFNNTDGSITGTSYITNAVASDGKGCLAIDYGFAPNLTTSQAVYSVLDKSIELPDNITTLNLEYKGIGNEISKCVRIVIEDANGKEHYVDVTSPQLGDWKQGSGAVPSGVVYPAKITKVGVLALNTTQENLTGTVYVDNISVVVGSTIKTDSNNGSDYKNVKLSDKVQSGYEDITVFGQSASGGNTTSLLSAMSENARAMLFVGNTNISNDTGVTSVVWEDKYLTTETDNFSIVNLATSSGSLITNGNEQLRWLQSYIYNMSNKNIIINMDRQISDLKDTRQTQALEKIFKKAVLEYDKNVIVVSATGSQSSVKAVDGVRYVTLAGFSESNPKYLRIRGNSADYEYELVSVN